MCWNTYFIVFSNINQNLPKMAKNTTSHILQNTGSKKTFCWTPHLTKNGCSSTCFFVAKNIDVEKAELKIRKKTNIKRDSFEWKQQDRKQKQIDEKLQFNVLMMFFSWKKSKEERDRTNEYKEPKQNKKQEGNIQERNREKMKRGRPKKAKEKKGRDSKINKNALFWGAKQVLFFVVKTKKEKEKTKPQIINKLGGFRAKWGGPK